MEEPDLEQKLLDLTVKYEAMIMEGKTSKSQLRELRYLIGILQKQLKRADKDTNINEREIFEQVVKAEPSIYSQLNDWSEYQKLRKMKERNPNLFRTEPSPTPKFNKTPTPQITR